MAKFQLNPGNQQGVQGYQPDRVRIGSISVFALVVIICLAVLAVLAFSTANASLTMAERQATATTELYQDERAAQAFVAQVDDLLAQARRDEAARAAEAAKAAQAKAAKGKGGKAGKAGSAKGAKAKDASAAAAKAKAPADAAADASPDAASAEPDTAQAAPAKPQLLLDENGNAVYDENGFQVVVEAESGDSRAGDQGIKAIQAQIDALCSQAVQSAGGGVTAVASVSGNKVRAEFSCENGRLLTVVLAVRNDGTYRIDRWKMSAVQNQEEPDGQLFIIDD